MTDDFYDPTNDIESILQELQSPSPYPSMEEIVNALVATLDNAEANQIDNGKIVSPQYDELLQSTDKIEQLEQLCVPDSTKRKC